MPSISFEHELIIVQGKNHIKANVVYATIALVFLSKNFLTLLSLTQKKTSSERQFQNPSLR
jgi:hypothetical protein